MKNTYFLVALTEAGGGKTFARGHGSVTPKLYRYRGTAEATAKSMLKQNCYRDAEVIPLNLDLILEPHECKYVDCPPYP